MRQATRYSRLRVSWAVPKFFASVLNGLLVAFLSGGRFDPDGYRHLYGFEDPWWFKRVELAPPLKYLYRREVLYFLGWHSVPEGGGLKGFLWEIRNSSELETER